MPRPSANCAYEQPGTKLILPCKCTSLRLLHYHGMDRLGFLAHVCSLQLDSIYIAFTNWLYKIQFCEWNSRQPVFSFNDQARQ